ncbi:hypothetical protein H1R20_g14397, partial [Candolleomyces eurysporus]
MLGVNVLARRALCSSLRSSAQSRLAVQTRSIHVSSPVLKKKQQNVDFDNLFDDMEIVDKSLPKQTGAPAKAKGKAQAGAKPAPTSSGRTRKTTKLSVDERTAKFDSIAEFVKTRTARNLQETRPAVRDSAWLQMLQLATSEEELKRVVELMPAWKEGSGGRVFTSTYSEAFVRRCQELDHPLLALQVFGDYARYNLNLTLPAARHLLYSLQTQPIDKLMTASALYGLYNLPAAAQDYVSCAIIVDACLRHNSADSNRIADALLPHLRQLQATTEVNTEDTYHRENVWVQKAMESVEKALKEREAGAQGTNKAAHLAGAASTAGANQEQTASA